MPEVAKHKGGAGKCASCQHPEVDTLNEQLITGVPLAQIAKRFGMAVSSLKAHKKNHLNPAYKAIQAAKKSQGVPDGRTMQEQLRDLLPILRNALHWAQGAQDKEGNFTVLPNLSQMVAVVRELRATLELLAKITGEYDDRPTTTINVLTTEAWLQTRSAINQALATYPEARLAVARNLMLLEGKVEAADPTSAVQEVAAGASDGSTGAATD